MEKRINDVNFQTYENGREWDADNRLHGGVSNFSDSFKRDTQYWNGYYAENGAPKEQSLFADWVAEEFIDPKEKKLLELGCGNGRDSTYFFRRGLNVTAIDASDISVKKLQGEFEGKNITFLCEDFVSSTEKYCNEFDYIYSRFSLHAINEKQQNNLIGNIYNALKEGGYFIIEVRSVNDELYGKGEKVGDDEYIYEGHYRRFVRKENLENLLKNAGLKLAYSCEKRGFAPYGESDPPIIRIVAEKKTVD